MNRRKFFHRLGLSMLTSFGIIGYFGLEKQKDNKKTITIPENKISDKVFIDGVFVQIIDNEPLFISAKCTHLGCNIDILENGQLICPCHGSKFNIDGSILEGPADKKLKALEFEYNTKNKTYTVLKNI